MTLGLIEEVVGRLKNGCTTTSCSSKLELSGALPRLVMDVWKEEKWVFVGCVVGCALTRS